MHVPRDYSASRNYPTLRDNLSSPLQSVAIGFLIATCKVTQSEGMTTKRDELVVVGI